MLDSITHIGAATGTSYRAAACKDALQERLRHVAVAVAASPRRRPRVLSIEGLKPLVAGGHWLTEMKARRRCVCLARRASGLDRCADICLLSGKANIIFCSSMMS